MQKITNKIIVFFFFPFGNDDLSCCSHFDCKHHKHENEIKYSEKGRVKYSKKKKKRGTLMKLINSNDLPHNLIQVTFSAVLASELILTDPNREAIFDLI